MRLEPVVTGATAAQAQSRDGSGPAGGGNAPPTGAGGEGREFDLGPGVARESRGRPYERAAEDPLYRPLWIYTLDPAASVMDGATAVVNLPFEPLEPGPRGRLFEVNNLDGATGEPWLPVDLNEPGVMLSRGRRPSPEDPRFHQQMVYAVCSLVYAAFRRALGRHVSWGFDARDPGGPARLRLVPHGGRFRNAYYDEHAGELRFGYYRAGPRVQGRNVPHGYVFTCLSHDIVAHEVTHALLDGLRSRFDLPTGPDVLAFHEGFADLVAIFQHFSYPEVVRAAIRSSRGALDQAMLLTGLAQQFGHTTGTDRHLRTAIDLDPATGALRPRLYDESDPNPHTLGGVLVSAVFDAFVTIFRRRTDRYLRLATGGTGILPPGEVPADLQQVLADEVSKLAGHFLNVLIRAVDYCPPVDLRLGEYLRAVLTADHELVPHDPLAYREAWIDAFGRHRIYPGQVRSLAEDALFWAPPHPELPPEPALSFAQLQFDGEPGCPAGPEELRRQARVLGRLVAAHPGHFGLARADDPALGSDRVELPRVEWIRSCRRIGPSGQVVFDLVAEVTQRRHARVEGTEFDFFGGATVILDPRGRMRFAVAKNVLNAERMRAQHRYLQGEGRAYWSRQGSRWTPARLLFRAMHQERGGGGG